MTETVSLILTCISTIATAVATWVTFAQYRREVRGDYKERRAAPIKETARPTVTPPPLPASIEETKPPPVPSDVAPSDPAGKAWLGKVWLALACFPWLNFTAWIWAAVKTGNVKYWLYAVMYALPFLIFGIMLEDAQATNGTDADPPTWTAVMGFISWVVCSFHAINTRKHAINMQTVATERLASG